MKKLALHWQIFIAMGLAVIVGQVFNQDSTFLGVHLYSVCEFFGQLFLNALKMIIVPLVFASIVCAIAGIAGNDNLGRLGMKTMGFYTLSCLLAILTGLILVNLFKPGLINGEPAAEQLSLQASEQSLAGVMEKVEGSSLADITGIFVRMIPTNIIDAAANGEMLALIFFAAVFGFFISKIDEQPQTVLLTFWQGVLDVMTLMTLWVMRFAPIGVFGLVAKIMLATGFAAFKPLMVFFITVAVALFIHAFVSLPLILKVVARVKPLTFIQLMSPVLLTAFSTASSSATLPLTMETVKKSIGVSNNTSSFVLPLGATINMDGTALYECVAAIFIAQAYGLELTFTQQFLIVFTALITSIGVAGIPAASLVAITVILGVIGLPLEGLALLLVTDRILDMMRTAVNVLSDASATLLIAKSEQEKTLVDA